MHELPLLQAKNPYDGTEQLNPVEEEENEGSYDLVAPSEGDAAPFPRMPGRHDVLLGAYAGDPQQSAPSGPVPRIPGR